MWRAEGKWLPKTSRKVCSCSTALGPALCCLPAPRARLLAEDWSVRSAVAIGKIVTAFSSQHFLMDMPRMPSSELLIKLLKRTVSKTESPELATKDPPSDDHGNSNGSHVKIFLPKKLLECLPKCSSLPKERHRWNTNEMEQLTVHFGLAGVMRNA
ncbi:calmodulin-binding transcription activator 1-like isoform X2 [Petaurus breviceps papuanus]|uniref:calmodulin-binding transcription activator 1-like isoform X2 n=1 Tax=Petaurus breviceps papuanus TaxID=3040969 RepID=UPI0036DF676F